MSSPALNYLIAIQLDNMNGLREMYNYLQSIQDFKNVEFTVGVTDQSMRSLSRQVASAVNAGVRSATGGGAPATGSSTASSSSSGTGQVELNASSLETAVKNLTEALSRLGRPGIPGGGGTPAQRFDGMSPDRKAKATKIYENLRNEVQEDRRTLVELERVVASKQRLTRDYAEKFVKVYTGDRRRQAEELISLVRSGGQSDEVIDAFEKVFSPTALQETLRQRIARGNRRLASADARPVSSFGGGDRGGEFRIGIDSVALNRAFENGAKLMGDAVTKSMQEATKAIASYFESAPRGGRDVSAQDYANTVSAVRPAGFEASASAIRNSIGKIVQQTEATRARIAEIDREVEIARSALANAEARAERDPQFKLSTKWRKQQEDKIAELTGERSERTRLTYDLANLERVRPQLEGQLIGMNTRQQYGVAASAEQMLRVGATMFGDPNSEAARADRRAGSYIGGLSTLKREVFIDAMNSGVLAIDASPKSLIGWGTKQQIGRNSAEIAEKEKERAAIQQEIAATTEKLKSASSKEERQELEGQQGRLGTSYQKVVDQIEALRRKSVEVAFRDVNKAIEASMAQFKVTLGDQFQSGQITDAEYKRRLGAFTNSENKLISLRASNPDIMQEAILFPQALAQYVKETLSKYRDQLKRMAATGDAIDPELMKEIQTMPILKQIAGLAPRDQKDANGAAWRVGTFLRDFNSAKTGFERFRPRAPLPAPRFNPNLSIDTVPMTPEEAGSAPFLQDQGAKAAYLARWQEQGGSFAPMTEERRAYVERMYAVNLKLAREQERQNRLGAMQETQKRMAEYQRELEFGGQYFKSGSLSADRNIVNGVLLAPEERKRVLAGGAMSSALPNPFDQIQAAAAANPFKGQIDTAKQFDNLLVSMEGHIARLSRTLADLAQANFDPLVTQFEKINRSLVPMAEAFKKMTGNLDRVVLNNVEYANKAETRVKESREKAAIRTKEAEDMAKIRATYRGAAELVQEQLRLESAAKRAGNAMPLLVSKMAPEELVEMVNRLGARANAQRIGMADQAARLATAQSNGEGTSSLMRRFQTMGNQYDATMLGYANAVLQADESGVYFPNFKKVNPAAAANAKNVLKLQAQRGVLGSELGQLTNLSDRKANIEQQAALIKQYGPFSTEKGNGDLKQLRSEWKKLDQEMKAVYARMASGGRISDADIGKLDAVKKKHEEITAQLGKEYDALIKNTKGLKSYTEEGGVGLDGFASKLQRLSQYVLAGGVVYTISNQLRQAVGNAVDADQEAKRLQGILDSKSGVQAQSILQSAYGSAESTGQSVQNALGLARVFSQTGASAGEVSDLTSAALRGQVGAGLEGNQAAEFLIAVRNVTQGQIAPGDIIDRISRIESQYAVSARDLSIAIQRAGSLAQQLQPQAKGAVSAIDLLIGSATAVIERTRVSGEQASTSLRFIFSRILQPEVGRALQNRFGVRLGGETPGSLRPLQDILGDVAGKYQDLNRQGKTAEASQLLVTFAGARQANAAAALLSDFSKALDVAKESASAYGETQRRVALQMDTIQAQYQRMQTSLSAMATSMINNSGLGYAVKGTLGFAAGAAESLANNGQGGTVGATVTGGAAGLLAAGGSALMKRFAMGSAARLGMTGVATIASGALGTAALAALALVVVNLVGAGLREVMEQAKDKVKDFDLKEFRGSDFYKAATEQAGRFGMSPEELQRAVIRAVAATRSSMIERYGKEVDDPNSKRSLEIMRATEDSLLRNMNQQIATFSQVGDRTAQLMAAQSLLGTNVKFSQAVSSESLSNFTKEATDFFTKAQNDIAEASKRAEARLPDWRDSRQSTAAFVGRFESEAARSLGFDGGYLGRLQGVQLAQAGGGTRSLAQVINSAPDLETGYAQLNAFVRKNLVLRPGNDSESLRGSVYGSLNRLQEQGKVVTQQSLLAQAMGDYAQSLKESGMKQREVNEKIAQVGGAMSDLTRVVANQERIVDTLMPQIEKRLNLSGARTQLEEDERRLMGVDDESFALGAALQQILTRAFERAKKSADRLLAGADPSDSANLTRLQQAAQNAKAVLETLGRTKPGTMLDIFDAKGSMRLARERMLEPYIQYATSMGEIRAMSGISQKYDIEYDSRRASYDAALQFRRNQASVEPRLLGDLVRTSFQRLFAGSAVSREQANSYLAPAMDGLAENERETMVTNLMSSVAATRAEEIRKADANLANVQTQYRTQLEMQRKDLLGLADSFGASGDSATAGVARQLVKDLGELITMIDGIKPSSTADEVQTLTERLREFQQRVSGVDGVVDRTLRQGAADRLATYAGQRDLATLQGSTQRGQSALQFGNEMRLLELQSLGARPDRILAAQLEGQAALTRRRLADDSALIDQQLVLERIQNAGNPVALSQRVLALENQRANQRANIEQEGSQAEQRLVQQTVQGLRQQQTQQLAQVVESGMGSVRNFLMSSRNFGRDGYRALAEGLGNAAQEAIVGNFLEKVQFMIQNPIIDSFRDGGLFSKQQIIEGFVEGSRLAAPAAAAAQFSLSPSGTPAGGTPTGAVSPYVLNGDLTGSYQEQLGALVPDVGAAAAAPAAAGAATLGKAAKWRQLRDSAMLVGGSLLGGQLGNVWGKKQNFGQEGASIGSLIGSSLGPVGGLIGGLAGGVLGGLFGKKDNEDADSTEVLQKIERNTREQIKAFENQTQLLQLDNRFVNVPSGFTVPTFRPFGVGTGSGSGSSSTVNNVSVTVNAPPGMNANEVGAAVAREISRQLGGAGSSFDVRTL